MIDSTPILGRVRALWNDQYDLWLAARGARGPSTSRYSPDDPHYGFGPVHMSLYVRVTWDWWLGHLPRSPRTGEGGNWWSWPMGAKAEEIPRVCHLKSCPHPWDTHHQFSIKTLVSNPSKWSSNFPKIPSILKRKKTQESPSSCQDSLCKMWVYLASCFEDDSPVFTFHNPPAKCILLSELCSRKDYRVATISRLLKIIGLFSRIQSLL